MVITVKGTNGQITADNEKVVISRKGFLGHITQGFKGDRTIYYTDIKSVEFKKATIWMNGYIQFITNAELATQKKSGVLHSSTEAIKDPNIVVFRAFKKEMVTDSQKIYNFIMNEIDSYKHSNSSSDAIQLSSADEITKFKKLLDENVITQDEFDKKKNELLNL
ncbi:MULTISPECIES: DUF4429 domain-containing protein [Companilactobacillus]|uniref:SHOCT domain-containing protein n=3 Tax=Companilactobacillus TaxID=2767879 RepID=A0A202F7P0_9LACO|nr:MULTISPECIES: DUF4429 domain-containing protein [Companilactobacillus]GEO58516.1 hypothetical protein LBO01_16450 [Companilactobacillus paralimentarius]KAE9557541.1 hypothetical protein ATN92_15410 [Companilactobacillus bobalius]KAE9563687.1 hypothetical protein ATN92_02860 [Companilactobacillus bobalius]KRK83433.1 hypothetical protein FC78_GL001389 [Companilactobacillus bobalius DSM 19674]OVE96509.1 hypothetical protein LKACC16343_02176 [Companilactobacillus bobalius]